MFVNVPAEGRKWIVVPVSSVSPTAASGATGTLSRYSWVQSLPSRRTESLSHSDSALTTETPTPCRPPETLYELSSNFPPACSTVMMTSAAERPSSAWTSTGMPRPSSETLTDSSSWMTTSISSQCPASASSIALSTTSKTMWWSPVPSSVSPMYMPGRLRTASRPLRTWMFDES